MFVNSVVYGIQDTFTKGRSVEKYINGRQTLKHRVNWCRHILIRGTLSVRKKRTLDSGESLKTLNLTTLCK